MSSQSAQSAYNPLSKRWYLTAAAYDSYIFNYDQAAGALVAIPGVTSGNCPVNRVLRETGRKLFPDANPGVINPMVAVYDEISFLHGYIDPNAAIFVVYTTDLPYFQPRGIDPITRLPNSGPPVYTQGVIQTAPTGYLSGGFSTLTLYNTGFTQVPYTNTSANADIFVNPYLANVFEVNVTTAESALTGTLTCYLRSANDPTNDLTPPEGQIISILFVNSGTNSISAVFSPGSTKGFMSSGPVTLTAGTATTVYFTLNGADAYQLTAGGGTNSFTTLSTISIGQNAGATNQGTDAVAIGPNAGASSQGAYGVTMGSDAGASNQGPYSVAIGAFAGQTNQLTNSIVINATGSTLNASTNSGLFIAPIRLASTQQTQLLTYNPTTKEIVQTINPLPYLTASPTSSAFGQKLVAVAGTSGLNWQAVSVSATGQYQTSVVYPGSIYTSSNYGATWAIVAGTSGKNWQAVSVSATGQYQTAVSTLSGGSLWTSSNYGATWVANGSAPSGFIGWYSVSVSATGQYQTAVVQGGSIYISSDYGVTWAAATGTSGKNWQAVSVSSTGQYQVAVVYQGSIYTSSDYGVSWAIVAGTSKYWASVSVSATGQYQTAVTNDPSGSIYISSNYGATWAAAAGTSVGNWASVSVSATGQYQIAAKALFGSGTIYISSNYGVTWAIVSGTSSKAWYGVSVSATGQYQTAVVNGGSIYTCSNNVVTGVATDKIALGYGAGYSNQGTNAIAIGQNAGLVNQLANSIVVNATGLELNASTNSGLFVAPIRNDNTAQPTLKYNTTTFELVYDTTKTFVIQHPKAESKYLVHACLEGPEAGVYYRGTSAIAEDQTSQTIILPDYVDALATEFTIHVTPIFNGTPRLLNVSRIQTNQFQVYGPSGEFDWHVYGKRLNVNVEPDKAAVIVQGQGPYKWIG